MRRLNSERGGVAVFVAILLVVVFGMGALVIDVGQMYWERRQLQTGAEAGALALAQDCVDGVLSCESADPVDLAAAAQPYADLNSADERSDVAGELLEGIPHAMPHGIDPAVCEPGGDVAPNPLATLDTVKVTTETIDASNEASFITHILAPVLGFDATTVSACAVAMWGYAASASTFPLVISACEYDHGTTTTYPAPHPNSGAVQEKLLFHAGTGGETCSAQAGQDTDGDGFLPAGFGWIENDGNCEVVTTVVDGDEWVVKLDGANPECSEPENLADRLNTVVQIPVFNDFCRPPHDPAPDCPDYNNKDKYRIATYASFYLQGYQLSGDARYKGGDYSSCTGSERCIVGYFTTSAALDGDIGGPPGGVKIVKLTG